MKTKICIFCGNKPISKNKEHVIPRWLIEQTGDPKRQAIFGIGLSNDNNGFLRKYSFDSFAFPACEECNNEFSSLEGEAKSIINEILIDNPVNGYQISVFLDWLDKVRVGLWLGFRYLDKNFASITPKFYIKTRLGFRDRFVVVYNTNYISTGINFYGTEGVSFQYSPSCFSLRINNLIFFNVSNFNLCDRRLGFPFSKNTKMVDEKSISIEINEGFQRVFYPVFKRPLLNNGIKLFQPMFKEQILNDDLKSFYDNDYVKKNSLNFEKGIGNVFIESKGNVSSIGKDNLIRIVPSFQHEYLPFSVSITKESFEIQTQLFEKEAHNKLKEYKKTIKFMKYSNKSYLQMITKSIIKNIINNS